eukprot:m.124319 g.124319  ORF g.124319 m.124319 type:complete len:82 (+) comp13773_c0_seq5:64-309(+)
MRFEYFFMFATSFFLAPFVSACACVAEITANAPLFVQWLSLHTVRQLRCFLGIYYCVNGLVKDVPHPYLQGAVEAPLITSR